MHVQTQIARMSAEIPGGSCPRIPFTRNRRPRPCITRIVFEALLQGRVGRQTTARSDPRLLASACLRLRTQPYILHALLRHRRRSSRTHALSSALDDLCLGDRFRPCVILIFCYVPSLPFTLADSASSTCCDCSFTIMFMPFHLAVYALSPCCLCSSTLLFIGLHRSSLLHSSLLHSGSVTIRKTPFVDTRHGSFDF
jgi:hypothetical protein